MDELYNLPITKVKDCINKNAYLCDDFTFDTQIVKYKDFMNYNFTQDSLKLVKEDIKDKKCKYIFFSEY